MMMILNILDSTIPVQSSVYPLISLFRWWKHVFFNPILLQYGVPPVIIHFHGISLKNHPAIGITQPWPWKPPLTDSNPSSTPGCTPHERRPQRSAQHGCTPGAPGGREDTGAADRRLFCPQKIRGMELERNGGGMGDLTNQNFGKMGR